MLIQLPNGLVDGADLFNYCEIDELRGKQQNYLANKELVVGNIGHVPKLLEDLVKSFQTKEGLKWQGNIKEAVWKIPVGDIQTILIKIRENTFGPEFYHELTCTHCQAKQHNLRLDLDKLELKPLTVEQLLDTARLTLTLPKSGKVVVLKPFFMRDMFDLIKLVRSDKQDEMITSSVCLSVKKIGEKTPISKKDLEDLSAKDLAFITEKVEEIKLEGEIDTTIETTCSSCGKDFSETLNVFDPDFFAPSKASST